MFYQTWWCNPNGFIFLPIQVTLQSLSYYSIPFDFTVFFSLETQCITYDIFRNTHFGAQPQST